MRLQSAIQILKEVCSKSTAMYAGSLDKKNDALNIFQSEHHQYSLKHEVPLPYFITSTQPVTILLSGNCSV